MQSNVFSFNTNYGMKMCNRLNILIQIDKSYLKALLSGKN
jgi:hypothetical protein